MGTEPFEDWLVDQAEKSESRSKTTTDTARAEYFAGRAEAFRIAAEALSCFRETDELLT